ncbi:MAG TPA: hypothetical protein VKR06_27365 [Ktedonosporobacter sp.]|nr:hypothetical protein [Ktedonosporobacter sp.]
MFCRYCKTLLFENKGPCPTCGAPSPLLGPGPSHNWGSSTPNNSGMGNAAPAWGNPASSQWEQPMQQPPASQWGRPMQQFPPASPAQSFAPPASPWEQSMQQFPSASPAQSFAPPASPQAGSQERESLPTSQRQSMLPVPYQGNMGLQQNPYQAIPLQLIPDHALENLLPALPQQEEMIYVPPMYTKPRAIIPRYRVLSGFLSFLIVMLALCGGVGYYAKTSGKLTAMAHFFTSVPPQNLQPTPTPKIPDPPDQTDKDHGPAATIIPSATTAFKIDAVTHAALIPQKIFTPGTQFFLVYNVSNNKKKGFVTIEWYMGDVLFSTQKSTDNNAPLIEAGANKTGYTNQMYPQPTSGMVILYWTDEGGKAQKAQTLYFAVRN